jgi:putative AlgH/UPF0301 family transcriptional regulator
MKKFGKNDVFYNTLSANPSYKVVFYNGNVTVNDQLSEGNKVSSSITMLERNTIYTASLSENFTKNNFFYSASFSISGTFSYTPQVQRNFIAYQPGGAFYEHYTLYNTVKKLYALNNIFIKYSLDNNNASTAKYLNTSLVQAGSLKNIYPSGYSDYFLKPLMDINFIEIPSAYYGIKLQPGMLNLKIYVGGPLELERGFFLHSAEYNKNLLFKLENSELAVSSNLEILKDITNGVGPKLNMFAIGYTGWNPGQIEFEIQNNLWIVAEPDTDLIFGNDSSGKWLTALDNLGIESSDFVPHMANC